MIIGNFTYDRARETYTGELATLTAAARKVVFQPSEVQGDKAPSHRVVSPGKTGFVELDDPSLAQPLNCALVESGDNEGFILVWSRDRRSGVGR
jgi:uncharacterized protein (DUF736 family)